MMAVGTPGQCGPVAVRRLAPDDAAAYRALMLEAYERHPDAFTSSRDERAALPGSWWRARLATGSDAPQQVLGAFDGARLCGAAGLAFETRERTRHKATLFGMVVRADQRRRGIGATLVAAVLARARAHPGLRRIALTVTAGNDAARALYERHGFVVFGVEREAVALGDGFVDKLHMDCDLTAVRPTRREPPSSPGEAPAAITSHDDWPADAAEVVDEGLGIANEAAAPLHEVRRLACIARADGRVAGGALGRRWGRCAELQQLWVAPAWRGHGLGARLVDRFEALARERGCDSFFLESFGFQAPGFYETLGYRTEHVLDVYPHGIARRLMVKRDRPA